MKVRDGLLIESFQVLYEKKVIIFGAGKIGRDILGILRWLPEVDIYSFCVSDIDEWNKSGRGNQVEGITVRGIEEIVEKMDPEKCFFIVAGNTENTNEMIQKLKEYYSEVDIDIVTQIGLYMGVYFNIGKNHFSNEFEEWIRIKNELATIRMQVSLQYDTAMRVYEEGAIWVYQPAKVGSTSIWNGLEECNVPSVHIHRIHTYHIEDYYYVPHSRNILKMFEQDESAHQGKKIISIVREPVSRSISQIFQWIGPDFIIEFKGWQQAKGNNLKETCLNRIYLDMKYGNNGYVFDWFDFEIKPVFGIDVYSHGFDKESGYEIIRENGVELLLLTMEKINSNEEIIREFCGCRDFKIKRSNVGMEKHYHYLYEETINNIKVPKEVLDFYYNNNPGMNHFYTKEDIESFRAKYS